ncbi:MAG: redox-sensing transcriptional repressor Rex [Acutalibacteraceae bacterium]|jgi:redox-sensing transcriptional repressor|nr:redox-sensing transcriptional repressor Rex [Acutalibacteraceae bacterium]
MNGYSIPKATLGRLPQYLEYLRSLPEIRRTISATAIAKALSLGDVQVRKDLAVVSGAGKPKIGYETDKLITDIESHLGCERLTNAVLVGAGKLGRALLDYDGFEDFGVKIVAGFDCNETVLTKGTKDILPIRDIEVYCREHDVKLGIITVGQGSAQDVCDKLVESGIKAIWNFAPVTLKVPNGVLLKQENLALSLAYLNNQISK